VLVSTAARAASSRSRPARRSRCRTRSSASRPASSGPRRASRGTDGASRFKSWERDHTLTSAFRDSVVWYFQRLATRVGDPGCSGTCALGYGNGRVGGHLTTFWLDGTLTITARGQLAFLAALERGALPFSAAPSGGARAAGLERARREDRHVHPHPGSAGWFVGHVEHGGARYVFVTLIRSKAPPFSADGASGPRARSIARELLRAAKLR